MSGLLTLNILFWTFLHPFELSGSHLSAIVGVNGNAFESVNNGQMQFPRKEVFFFIYTKQNAGLYICKACAQTACNASGWFYAEKMD